LSEPKQDAAILSLDRERLRCENLTVFSKDIASNEALRIFLLIIDHGRSQYIATITEWV